MFEDNMEQSPDTSYYTNYDIYEVDCDDGTYGDKIFIPHYTKVE